MNRRGQLKKRKDDDRSDEAVVASVGGGRRGRGRDGWVSPSLSFLTKRVGLGGPVAPSGGGKYSKSQQSVRQ